MKSFLQGYVKKLFDGLFKMDPSKSTNTINWDGKVVQKDLELDPELFERFKIDTEFPLTIVKGFIQELAVSVPWMSLNRDNINAKAKNCFALVKLDVKKIHEFVAMEQEIKAKKCLVTMEQRIIETFKQIQNKKPNYFTHLILSLVKNLQVYIENLRIRVEIVDFSECIGGFELVFNELTYDHTKMNQFQVRFDGEIESSGLSIVDLRLKYISKQKLFLKQYGESEMSQMKIDKFSELFKSDKNALYCVNPFLFHINFKTTYLSEDKKTFHKAISFEFSPLSFNVSNEAIQLIRVIINVYNLLKDYHKTGRPLIPYQITMMNPDDKHFFNSLRLNAALHKALRENHLKDIRTLKENVALIKKQRQAYEFAYEVKMLHLMENEFEKKTERLYDLHMTIPDQSILHSPRSHELLTNRTPNSTENSAQETESVTTNTATHTGSSSSTLPASVSEPLPSSNQILGGLNTLGAPSNSKTPSPSPLLDHPQLSIQEVIDSLAQYEESLHFTQILFFRESVMARLRQPRYFRSLLVERKKFINDFNEKNEGAIKNYLKKGISKLWAGKEEKKDPQPGPDDTLLNPHQSQSVEESIIKSNLVRIEKRLKSTFEFSCPLIKISLTRNQTKLLEAEVLSPKFSFDIDIDKKVQTIGLKVERARIYDDCNRTFIEFCKEMRPKGFIAENALSAVSSDQTEATGTSLSALEQKVKEIEHQRENVEVETPSLKKKSAANAIVFSMKSQLMMNVEGEGFKLINTCLDLNLQHCYGYFSKELLSKLIYFFIDFTMNVTKGKSSSRQPKNNSPKPAIYLDKVAKLDHIWKSFECKTKSLLLVFHHSMTNEQIGLHCEPNLTLEKNETRLGLPKMQVFYSDQKTNLDGPGIHPENLASIPKFIKEINLSVSLVRTAENRLSLDFKMGNMEVFVSDVLLSVIASLIQDLSTIKLLNMDSFVKSINKQPKTIATKKKKPLIIRNKKSVASSSYLMSHLSKSRKNSRDTFKTVNSSICDDDFMDAFEDEADLFAHNELKSRMDFIENAAMMLSPDLGIIEENDPFQDYVGRERDAKLIELGMTFYSENLTAILFAKSDIRNYVMVSMTKPNIYFDFKELSVQVNEIDIVLKQNIVTLAMKDFYQHIQRIIEVWKNRYGDQKANSTSRANNKKSEKGFGAVLSNLRSFLDSEDAINLEIEVKSHLNIYITEQTDRLLTPGCTISLKPILNVGAKMLKLVLNLKIDIFNEEVGFYEPFIEEMQADIILSTENNNIKTDCNITTFLINCKPSILKNLLDYISVYSTQKIKLSAERNSVLTLKNETGVMVSYSLNSGGPGKNMKPFEKTEVNLFVAPRNFNGEEKVGSEGDLSTDGTDFTSAKAEILKDIVKTSEDEGSQFMKQKGEVSGGTLFSKKKLFVEIPSFGVKCPIDLSNMTDSHIHVVGNLFLVAKLEVENYKTILTLRSSFVIINKLNFDIECAAYIRKSNYAKEDVNFGALRKNKRKKSDAMSEGAGADNLSQADSIDFSISETPKKLNFQNGFQRPMFSNLSALAGGNNQNPFKLNKSGLIDDASSGAREILLFKFIIKSKGRKYLPLLKNFPKNYFITAWPANLDFYSEVSSRPSEDMNYVRQNSTKTGKVFLEELMKRNCCLSKHGLLHGKYPELIFSFQLSSKLQSIDKETDEKGDAGLGDAKNGGANDPETASRRLTRKQSLTEARGTSSILALCEHELNIKYPLKIINCLPSSLEYRLTRLNETMLQEADTFSRMSLSRLGNDMYEECFNNQENIHYEDKIDKVSKQKIIGISPDIFPLLTLKTAGSESKSFIKLQKYIMNVV